MRTKNHHLTAIRLFLPLTIIWNGLRSPDISKTLDAISRKKHSAVNSVSVHKRGKDEEETEDEEEIEVDDDEEEEEIPKKKQKRYQPKRQVDDEDDEIEIAVDEGEEVEEEIVDLTFSDDCEETDSDIKMKTDLPNEKLGSASESGTESSLDHLVVSEGTLKISSTLLGSGYDILFV